jgi:putative DNA primase/helicase
MNAQPTRPSASEEDRRVDLPTADNIPAELRHERRWVVAQAKVPYRPLDATRRADTTDPATWSDFDTAWHLVESGRFPMLGFVLGNGFVGVDLDKCRNAETGVIESWATDIIELLDSYTETSVSGTGVHVICLGKLPAGRRRKGKVEMYESARYFVVTGQTMVSAPIEDRTAELAVLHANTFGRPEDSDQPATLSGATDLTDDAVLDRARSASNGGKFQRLWSGDLSGYDSRSEADLGGHGLRPPTTILNAVASDCHRAAMCSGPLGRSDSEPPSRCSMRSWRMMS